MAFWRRWIRGNDEKPQATLQRNAVTTAPLANPDTYQSHLERGCEAMATCQVDAAVSHLTRAVDLAANPLERIVALSNRARVRILSDAASPDLDEVIRMAPGGPSAYFDRGSHHSAKGNHEAAAKDFGRAIALLDCGPDQAMAYANRATSLSSLNRFSNALSDLSKARELFPGVPGLAEHRNALHEQMTRVAHVETTGSVPDGPTNLRNGWEEDRAGNLVDALVAFATAAEQMPQDASVWYAKGVVNCKLRRSDQAINDLTKAIELRPQFAAALAERGMAYAAKKDYLQAMADYELAIKADPHYSVAHINKGSLLAVQGRWPEALVALDAGIHLHATPEALFNRSVAHEQLGNGRQAIEDLAAFLRHIPTGPLAVQAQQRLAKLQSTAGT